MKLMKWGKPENRKITSWYRVCVLCATYSVYGCMPFLVQISCPYKLRPGLLVVTRSGERGCTYEPHSDLRWAKSSTYR